MAPSAAMRPPPDLAVPYAGRDPDQLPQRCVIHLMPGQLSDTVLAAVPENLRRSFYFYGSVTPAEYLQLSGKADFSDLKWCLAIETAGADNFAIKVTPEDVLTQESGAKALQSRLIRYWLEKAGQEYPYSDLEYMEIAKTIDEMPYAAIEFLLSLADLYGVEAGDLADEDIAEALADEQPPMAWDEFAHPYPEV